MIISLVLSGLFVWFVLGCAVLASIDHDAGLYRWASNAPLPFLYELIVMAWPYFLWLWWKHRRSNV